MAAVWAAAFHLQAGARADLRLLFAFQHLLRVDNVPPLLRIASLMDAPEFAALSVVALAIAARRRAWGDAARGAVIVIGAELSAQLLKRLTAAPREPLILPHALWPSGHITAAAAVSVAFVLVVAPAWRGRVAIAAGLVSGAIALAVLGLVTHHPSDALGALLLTGAWTAGALAFAPGGAGRAWTWGPALVCVAAGVALAVVYTVGMAALGHVSPGTVWDVVRAAPGYPGLAVAIGVAAIALPVSVALALEPSARARPRARR
jgi:hypothetical protein